MKKNKKLELRIVAVPGPVGATGATGPKGDPGPQGSVNAELRAHILRIEDLLLEIRDILKDDQ